MSDHEEQLPTSFRSMSSNSDPDGRYTFAVDSVLKGANPGRLIGRCGSSVYLKNGTLNGIEITYITKIWSVSDHWLNFHTELYLYAHPKLLRPLQGICVPYFIGVYAAPGGRVCVAMEPPHSTGWRTASPTIPAEVKEAIIEAYTKIHAQGIEHGDVAYRHMLIGDDSKITIIDFSKSKCVFGSSHQEPGLVEATPESLAREMRKVKFFLDHDNSKKTEYARTNDNTNQCQLKKARIVEPVDEDDNPPFTLLELEEWEAEGGRDMRFEIRPNRGSGGSHPEGSKTEPFPRRYEPESLEFNTVPCANVTGENLHDTASLPSVATPSRPSPTAPVSANRKRSGDSEENTSAAKRIKVVRFHPDTSDNGLWATGRPLRKMRRQPTPYIHEEDGIVEYAEEQQLNIPMSLVENGGTIDMVDLVAGSDRHLSKMVAPPTFPKSKVLGPNALVPTTSQSTGRFIREAPPRTTFAMKLATKVLACPPMSIVLTDETGELGVWQVSEDVFHDVVGYVKLRMTNHLPPEMSDTKGKGRAGSKVAGVK